MYVHPHPFTRAVPSLSPHTRRAHVAREQAGETKRPGHTSSATRTATGRRSPFWWTNSPTSSCRRSATRPPRASKVRSLLASPASRLHLACISPASRLHLALDGPHSVIFDSVTRSPAPSYPLTDRLGRSPLPHPPYSPRCLSPAGLGSYSWTNPTLELFNTSHAHAVG